MIESHSRMRKILILGGTTEASDLAAAISAAQIPAILSYAGRVDAPRAQPIPVRVGGFGGVSGLQEYLRAEGIGQVIDATHPFAQQISNNAVIACRAAAVPLLAIERPKWQARPGDPWHCLPDIAAAAAGLSGAARRVFLAIGRQHLDLFTALEQHFFLLRLVDHPQAPLAFRNHHITIDRGPFSTQGDLALLRAHGIDLVVAKNAGGRGAEAKLHAARALGIEVMLIDRPRILPRQTVSSTAEAMDWLHSALGV